MTEESNLGKGIIEASNLPQDEKIYLKKDVFGWRVVEPFVDPVTGKKNWFSIIFGGKKGLFITIITLLISALFYFGIKELIAVNVSNAMHNCTNLILR